MEFSEQVEDFPTKNRERHFHSNERLQNLCRLVGGKIMLYSDRLFLGEIRSSRPLRVRSRREELEV